MTPSAFARFARLASLEQHRTQGAASEQGLDCCHLEASCTPHDIIVSGSSNLATSRLSTEEHFVS
jgi:hypothetical protein